MKNQRGGVPRAAGIKPQGLDTPQILNKLKHNKMYKVTKPTPTTLKVNNSYRGETIEQKVDRVINNKEPISDGAPIVYTDRADGVLPEYDPRTDKWEIATDAMGAVTKTKLTKRETAIADRKKKDGNTDTKDTTSTNSTK